MFVSINDPKVLPSKELYGGKGAGLIWMTRQGLNVPPAIVIPTTVCQQYMVGRKSVMEQVVWQIPKIIEFFKNSMGYVPLLSVRSGSRESMPGMMDTILNVGLVGVTDHPVSKFWQEKLGMDCWANSLHRLINMYMGVVKLELPLSLEGQLAGAIEAVFNSWNNERAKFYRKINKIPDDWGTAVVIQAMVFGNLNDNSGSGVLFTRNPDTGENVVVGEFLPKGQGEDVVAGVVKAPSLKEMGETHPEVAKEVLELADKLEKLKQDVQDVEFTVQDGKLYLLQTRTAKRSSKAAVRIAVDMVSEGLITVEVARTRVTARDLDLATTPAIDPKFKLAPDFTGIGASSGVVTGKPVFSSKDAIACKEPCILITMETTPDDIAGMNAAVGVLTMQGGATSHAAVVARGMNKPCVVGLGNHMDAFQASGVVSIDGATGRVWFVAVPVSNGKDSKYVIEFRNLVSASLGIVPIVQVPTFKSKELMLDLGGEIDVVTAVAKVKTASLLCETLYIDFRRTGRPEAETSFDRLFGFVGMEKKMVDAVRDWLAEVGGDAFSKVRAMVSQGIKTKLKTVGASSDIKSMILASGTIMIEGVFDDATKWVMEKKIVEGVEFVVVGNYVCGTKSFLSIDQAMQL